MGYKFKNVEEYMQAIPAVAIEKAVEIRDLIRQLLPDAKEVISYNMPGYRTKGILVWFAAYNGHIGFYPGSSGIEQFNAEFGHYKWSKGAVQFPLNEPLPVALITRMVQFKLDESLNKNNL
jgi:uncharacterized protein YdhG (YjbR/CyaY superfamily)